MRIEADKLVDAVLLAYFLQKSAPVYGRTKVQKSAFLVGYELRQAHLVGAHFKFIRYLKGPFSFQIWDTYDALATNGFVHRKALEPTERGQFLIDLIVPELRKTNERTFEIADRVLAWCQRRNGNTLMRHVYALQVAPDEEPQKRMKVVDIPMGWTILAPPPGGLIVPPPLEALIKEELSLTQADLDLAHKRYPETEKLALNDLDEALSAYGQP